MNRVIRHFGIIVFVLLITSCQENHGDTVQLITVSEMKSLMQLGDVQLVDVRSEKEFASGHISRAQNIVYLGDNWEKEFSKLDREKPVLVYCERGGRSKRCTNKLVAAGFQKIYDLEGGIQQWKFAGEPLEN